MIMPDCIILVKQINSLEELPGEARSKLWGGGVFPSSFSIILFQANAIVHFVLSNLRMSYNIIYL